MRMAKPSHPGELILIALGDVSVSEAAKCMGLARCSLSRVINGHASVTPDMAYRLGQFLGTTTELWLNMQMQYDVWRIEHREEQPNIVPKACIKNHLNLASI